MIIWFISGLLVQLLATGVSEFSTKRDQFFRRGRVNGNGVVKVGFCGSHFHRNSKPLQHFITPNSLHVDPNHLGNKREGHLLLRNLENITTLMTQPTRPCVVLPQHPSTALPPALGLAGFASVLSTHCAPVSAQTVHSVWTSFPSPFQGESPFALQRATHSSPSKF